MTDEDQHATPQQPPITPEKVEAFFGTVAVTTVSYLIAGMRWLKGEGHYDETIHPLMKQVLDLLVPHILKQMQQARRIATVYVTDNLADIYRHYQAGTIPDQTTLQKTVAEYLAAWELSLTSGQLAMLTPDTATISKHGGPVQFAQYAFGRLEQVHWKTVHNWARTIGNVDLEQVLPFGILVTRQEIREFIDTHLRLVEEAIAHLKQTYSAADQVIDAGLAEARRMAALQDESVGVPTDSAPAASKKPSKRKVGGPGRPSRRKA